MKPFAMKKADKLLKPVESGALRDSTLTEWNWVPRKMKTFTFLYLANNNNNNTLHLHKLNISSDTQKGYFITFGSDIFSCSINYRHCMMIIILSCFECRM